MNDYPHTRRTFVRNGSLFLVSAGFIASPVSLFADESKRKVRVALITDLHYAEKPPAGSRFYRETLAKLEEAGTQFEKDKPDFVVELGDLIDAADAVDVEKAYLARINKEFTTLPGDKHYVLGNHCVDTLTKKEFLGEVGQKSSFYSFDVGGFHFAVLDACFRKDGQPYGRKNSQWNDSNISEEQVEWLKSDLKDAPGKAIVFIHQRLDVKTDYGVRNAEEVRKVLEDSGKVLAVFQGHNHINALNDINGIHYCTLMAMIEGSGAENNCYSTMDVFDDGTIRVKGFRKQANYEWK